MEFIEMNSCFMNNDNEVGHVSPHFFPYFSYCIKFVHFPIRESGIDFLRVCYMIQVGKFLEEKVDSREPLRRLLGGREASGCH